LRAIPLAGLGRPSGLARSGSAEVEKPEEDGENEIPPEVADLFDTLRDEALRRLDEFGPIHLFSLCWAYSTARLLDDNLQQRITGAALRLGQKRDREGRPKQVEEAGQPEELDRREEAEDNVPRIVQQTDHWMALYKPPNWMVNVDSKEAAKAASVAPFEDDEDDGDGEEEAVAAEFASEEQRRRPKLHTWIRHNLAGSFPICSDPLEAFGLLHRLDAQTSGLLLCAKTYVGAYWLRLQWCSYAVDKEYICLVHGWVDRKEREIHKRIRVDKKKAPNSRKTVSTHCTVGASGKPSYTELFTLAHLTRPGEDSSHEETESQQASDSKYSLVVLKLHTGRTHQIRVHMQSIGHPLVTDAKYADNFYAADRTWCPRNFLHTYRLGFDDVPALPGQKGDSSGDGADNSGLVELRTALPADLRATLAALQPVDDVSAGHHATWLTTDTSKMVPFDEYVPEVGA